MIANASANGRSGRDALGELQSEKEIVNGKQAEVEMAGLAAWESIDSTESIRDRPGFGEAWVMSDGRSRDVDERRV